MIKMCGKTRDEMREYLIKDGYDGLSGDGYDGYGCGCGIDA
jgi:hypothetical protein